MQRSILEKYGKIGGVNSVSPKTFQWNFEWVCSGNKPTFINQFFIHKAHFRCASLFLALY